MDQKYADNSMEMDHSVSTRDIKGEIRKERGLNWAYISLGIIATAILITAFVLYMILPSVYIESQTPNSNVPVQGR